MIKALAALSLVAATSCRLPQSAGTSQAAGTPQAAPLVVTESSLRRLAEGVVYDGEPADRLAGREVLQTFEFGATTYIQTKRRAPLFERDETTGAMRTYSMFALAVRAGWFEPTERRYLPGNVRGVHRVGASLWMGSDGVGALKFDPGARSWTRYDVKDTPVPGHHLGVLSADDDYVFVSFGRHRDLPKVDAGLHVYSQAKDAWLRIESIPIEYVVSLGYGPSDASAPADDRRYRNKTHIPPRGNEIKPDPDGDYRLRLVYSTGTVTEMRLSRAALGRAFTEAERPSDRTEP